MSRSTTHRLGALATIAVATAGLLIGTTTSAAADFKDGVLETNEFGLYYNSGLGGCVFDVYDSDSDFSNDKFKGSCSGSGQTTNDNTASYWNRDNVFDYYVYTDANYRGSWGTIPSGYSGDASSTFKNEISATNS
ncbi:peptidase inhibitor family I36 protein [Streptomyces gobiensis]|uniref:peptidase inhibitor family I36 protein n=1 Tax=Streptomyces gobiensis TaxID=2875706 RepID=UPI001E2B2A0F|nr:peptidase inhibitor family I36 protein [Streptomyces gobiensis]UGY92685.1 peptidase inhibitor family I36 protein [Streptomyces gobiensis]